MLRCGLLLQIDSHSRLPFHSLKSVTYVPGTARRCHRMYTGLPGKTRSVYRYRELSRPVLQVPPRRQRLLKNSAQIKRRRCDIYQPGPKAQVSRPSKSRAESPTYRPHATCCSPHLAVHHLSFSHCLFSPSRSSFTTGCTFQHQHGVSLHGVSLPNGAYCRLARNA